MQNTLVSVVVLIIVAVAAFIYLKKSKNEVVKKIMSPLQILIASNVNRFTVYFKNLLKSKREAKRREELLKQKIEEQKLKAKYLRKQKLSGIKGNVQQKIYSVYRTLTSGMKKETTKAETKPKRKPSKKTKVSKPK